MKKPHGHEKNQTVRFIFVTDIRRCAYNMITDA